jgi:hypothetical protein
MLNRLALARDASSRLPSLLLRGAELVKKRVATAAPALCLLQRRQLLWLAEQTTRAALLWAPSLVVGHARKLSTGPVIALCAAAPPGVCRRGSNNAQTRPELQQAGIQRNGQEQVETLVRLLLEPMGRGQRQKVLGLLGS